MRPGRFLLPHSVMGYEDLDVVDPTAGEAKGAEGAAPLSEVRRRRRLAAGLPAAAAPRSLCQGP